MPRVRRVDLWVELSHARRVFAAFSEPSWAKTAQLWACAYKAIVANRFSIAPGIEGQSSRIRAPMDKPALPCLGEGVQSR